MGEDKAKGTVFYQKNRTQRIRPAALNNTLNSQVFFSPSQGKTRSSERSTRLSSQSKKSHVPWEVDSRFLLSTFGSVRFLLSHEETLSTGKMTLEVKIIFSFF